MTKADELKKTLEQLRRDTTAAKGRYRKLLIDGGDTTAVMAEMDDIVRRIDEAEHASVGAVEEEQQLMGEAILASATDLVERIRAQSDARVDALKPPTYPKEPKK